MTKKLLVPLVILGVVLATGLGIYIASNQSIQPTTGQTDTPPKNELYIKEIDRTLTPSRELGKLNYTANGPASMLLYSDTYEKLNGCAGRHLAELQLKGSAGSDAPIPDKAVAVGGQYQYAEFIPQPMGECAGDEGRTLAEALYSDITNAR